MTYRELIETAKRVPAGDTGAAQRWLAALQRTLKTETLTPNERTYLYKLRRIWRQRAAGRDMRWNVFGCTPGARPDPTKAAMRRLTAVDPLPQQIEDGQAQTVRADDPAPVAIAPAPTPAAGSAVASLLDKYR